MSLPPALAKAIEALTRAGDWAGLRAVAAAAVAPLVAEGQRRGESGPWPSASQINAALDLHRVKACRDADVAPLSLVPARDELLPALAVGAARGKLVLLAACDDQRYWHGVHGFAGHRAVREGSMEYVTELQLDRLDQARAVQDGLRRAWPELYAPSSSSIS